MEKIKYIVWFLPIIFMLHDFEEVIMAEVWSRRYADSISTVWPNWKPFGLKYINYYQTPTFAIGVGTEFILASIVSFFSSIVQGYFLWFGAFTGLILHFIVIHILLCIKFKGYVPGIITSVVFMLPCIWCLYEADKILQYGVVTILLACVCGSLLTVVLFQVLHRIMGPLSAILNNYSSAHSKE